MVGRCPWLAAARAAFLVLALTRPTIWIGGRTEALVTPPDLILTGPPFVLQLRSQVRRSSGPFVTIWSHTTLDRGEGWTNAMVRPGMDGSFDAHGISRPSMNSHGSRPPSWGHFKGMYPRLKRSYKRARLRATIAGYAWYRGKLLDRQQLGCNSSPSVATTPVRPSNPPRVVHRDMRNRLHIVTWNSTGLAAWKLDELRGWLHLQQVQVVVLLETRWQYDKEWVEDGWFHIACSGNPFRSCGILIMIKTTLCPPHQISWQSIVPGRILHVRIHLNRSIDIVGCYQHTYTNTLICKQQRMHWIKTLDGLLYTLPKRNNLIVLGDWNCGLPQTLPFIGVTDFVGTQGRLTGPMHADHLQHLELVHGHDLCAINTWRHDTGPTCCTAKGDLSRIDFIFIRRKQADREAMQSMPIESFDLLGPSKIGHRPVLGSINLAWRPSTGSALHHVTYQSRINCRAAQQDESKWNAFHSANLALVTEAKWTDFHDLQHTQEMLTRNFCAHFASRNNTLVPVWQKSQSLMSRKWELLARIRSFHTPSLHTCFRTWKLLVAHRRCHDLQKRCSRQARTERSDRMLDEACTAASRHDLLLCKILFVSSRLKRVPLPSNFEVLMVSC